MKLGIESYIHSKGVQVSRPGNEKRGRFAVSYHKFKAFLKQFKQVNGELKNLPKSEPWLNCVGLIDLQPDNNGVLKPARTAICIYVWDTKKVVGIVDVPLDWYLQNTKDPNDKQDFISIFVTQRRIPWITVIDPMPGPNIKSF
jgi:hypothetical protein